MTVTAKWKARAVRDPIPIRVVRNLIHEAEKCEPGLTGDRLRLRGALIDARALLKEMERPR